jgi:hypothetical protein
MELAEESATTVNAARTGKGTRVAVRPSRGRSPQPITHEVFDLALPETLPGSITEFMELTQINEEAPLVSLLMAGYNDWSYTQASDPVAEFIESSWPEEIQKNFRAVVRQYASGINCSIEDAVALIKPQYLAAQAKLVKPIA